ncbi:MAG: T9SS type A sorting domain-containing protein, partial [Phaeodactylibacter sp.]|nr:T9SS type A sorting domain-containing protein [Phaeodactylibacter sp.]
GKNTTQIETHYTYADERPLPGLNYYRLRQIDLDGQFEYSGIVSVDVGGADNGIRLYPNPASGSVTLAFETAYFGAAVFYLYNAIGQPLKTEHLSLEPGAFRTGIELDGLPAGVYLVEVRYGARRLQRRLVVQ